MFRIRRKMLIGVMSVFLLCFSFAVTGNAAGIELAFQEKQTESGQESEGSFVDYDVPIGMIQKKEESTSQTEESTGAQTSQSEQERINSTVNVGARTLDSTRTRALTGYMVCSAGILTAGLLYRRRGRRS